MQASNDGFRKPKASDGGCITEGVSDEMRAFTIAEASAAASLRFWFAVCGQTEFLIKYLTYSDLIPQAE